jgi:conjugative transfer region protein TrbK
MMAVAILAATRDRAPTPPPIPATMRDTEGRSWLNRELDRCATLTMPDSGCEAAWAENRRRFFHQDEPEGAGR